MHGYDKTCQMSKDQNRKVSDCHVRCCLAQRGLSEHSLQVRLAMCQRTAVGFEFKNSTISSSSKPYGIHYRNYMVKHSRHPCILKSTCKTSNIFMNSIIISHVNWEHKAVIVMQTCLQLNCNLELASHSQGWRRIELGGDNLGADEFPSGFPLGLL